MMEDGFGEVPDPALGQSRCILHTEVQVEPVSQLDLKAHPDCIVPLLTWYVEDKPTAKVVQ